MSHSGIPVCAKTISVKLYWLRFPASGQPKKILKIIVLTISLAVPISTLFPIACDTLRT